MYTKKAELVFLFLTLTGVGLIVSILHFGFGLKGHLLVDSAFIAFYIFLIISALISKYYLRKTIKIGSVDDMRDGIYGGHLSQYYIPLNQKEKVIEEIKNLGFSLHKEKRNKATYSRKGKNLFQDRLLKTLEDDQFFYVIYAKKIYDEVFMKYTVRYQMPRG